MDFRMNQILSVENQKNEKRKKIKSNKTIEIEGIVKFFAVALIVFGTVFIGQGSYAIYKNVEENKPQNIPNVQLARLNDNAIVYVQSKNIISKIVYSWGDGQESAIPIGTTYAEEEITLLGTNSVLNLTIEDINGKQYKYQKEYKLEGVDITKPSINIETSNGSNIMKITATDEKEIAYLSYQWEGEEKVEIFAEQQGQTQITKEIELTPGIKKITIIAKDANGNVEEILEKEIEIYKSEPKMTLQRMQNGKIINIIIEDEDGLQEVTVNINGEESSKKDINGKVVKVLNIELQEGNNTISATAINIHGCTTTNTIELRYDPN